MCNLCVATTDRYVDPEGVPAERTQWHSVVVVGQRALECAKVLHKGAPVALEGKLKTRTYIDTRHVVHERTEVVCDAVVFPERRATRTSAKTPREVPAEVAAFMGQLEAAG